MRKKMKQYRKRPSAEKKKYEVTHWIVAASDKGWEKTRSDKKGGLRDNACKEQLIGGRQISLSKVSGKKGKLKTGRPETLCDSKTRF